MILRETEEGILPFYYDTINTYMESFFLKVTDQKLKGELQKWLEVRLNDNHELKAWCHQCFFDSGIIENAMQQLLSNIKNKKISEESAEIDKISEGFLNKRERKQSAPTSIANRDSEEPLPKKKKKSISTQEDNSIEDKNPDEDERATRSP